MKFSFLYFLAILIHGTFSWINERHYPNSFLGNHLEKRNGIINKFNFAFVNDKRTMPVLRQQEAFRIFKEMQNEKKRNLNRIQKIVYTVNILQVQFVAQLLETFLQ